MYETNLVNPTCTIISRHSRLGRSEISYISFDMHEVCDFLSSASCRLGILMACTGRFIFLAGPIFSQGDIATHITTISRELSGLDGNRRAVS